jgi:hypothetical protein
MIHPDIFAALGRERLNTLLADAEAARTGRRARLHRRQAGTPARAKGIQRFTALVAAANAAMAGLLQRMRAHLLRRNPSTAEYQISLSPGGDGPQQVTEGLAGSPSMTRQVR